jgi:hypothetical protein
MSTICRLVQSSAEWHEHRRKHRNASETPIVLGVSPWRTPYQLWPQIHAAWDAFMRYVTDAQAGCAAQISVASIKSHAPCDENHDRDDRVVGCNAGTYEKRGATAEQ